MNSKQLLIDVREPFEYKSGHVEGAINITPADLISNPVGLNDVNKDTNIIVYCRTGSRSNAAIQILKGMGFTNLINCINAGYVAKNYLR